MVPIRSPSPSTMARPCQDRTVWISGICALLVWWAWWRWPSSDRHHHAQNRLASRRGDLEQQRATLDVVVDRFCVGQQILQIVGVVWVKGENLFPRALIEHQLQGVRAGLAWLTGDPAELVLVSWRTLMLSSVTGCFTLGIASPCWLSIHGRPVGRPRSCCEDTECSRHARDAHQVAETFVFLVTGTRFNRLPYRRQKGLTGWLEPPHRPDEDFVPLTAGVLFPESEE
jgi:hypothetical protein